MTVVRDLNIHSGAIVTDIGSCDVTDDQTHIAYVRLLGSGNQWLMARHNSSIGDAGKFLSLGYEGANLLFYPGTHKSGQSLPTEKWLLLGGVIDSEADGHEGHFYAYDLESEELLFAVDDGSTIAPTHSSVAERLVFGRWNSTEQLEGLYAGAAIYTTALSEAEFLALASASSVEKWGSLSPTPLGLWVFDQNEGEETLDLTGNGADGVFAVQPNFAISEVEVPLPLREKEKEGGGGGKGVQVKVGGDLVEGKRYVKQGGILIPG